MYGAFFMVFCLAGGGQNTYNNADMKPLYKVSYVSYSYQRHGRQNHR